jgi:isopropylmalate/homocitrate/citramalate synthase
MEEELVHNYVLEKDIIKGLPEKVIFWEETLRDGEQTPGVVFTVDEKLKIARMLDDMGVGIMDVGIPVVSKEEFKAVKAIANEGLKATIIGAARTVKSDIDACVDADVDETSIFIACSDLHLKYKLQMSREKVLEISVESCEYAKDHGLDVAFVTEDTVRADLDFVTELYNACTEAGAKRAVLCDTVGVMTPAAMRWWIGEIKERFKPVQLSIHCHNDLGMAVANSLAAVECGVEVPHTTVNGIGERSGNASFEELVMALEVLYGHRTGIDLSKLYELSKTVEEISGIPLAINKPIVGYNAFSHESGIHAGPSPMSRLIARTLAGPGSSYSGSTPVMRQLRINWRRQALSPHRNRLRS